MKTHCLPLSGCLLASLLLLLVACDGDEVLGATFDVGPPPTCALPGRDDGPPPGVPDAGPEDAGPEDAGPACDDRDPCTRDVLAPGGCTHVAIDDDGDGHGPLVTGCGLDCDDTNPAVFPRNPAWSSAPYMSGGATSYDYDCSGTEDRRWDTFEDCSVAPGMPCGGEGWHPMRPGGVPDCGETYTLRTCISAPGGTCAFSDRTATQECR